MKLHLIFSLVLIFALPLVDADAQGSQCLYVFGQESLTVYYEVNLDTGLINVHETYPRPPQPPADTSPDGFYTVDIDWEHERQLKLTDNRVGVSVSLADAAHAPSWSPDGLWLAYVRSLSQEEDVTLNLFSIETHETTSVVLTEGPWVGQSDIHWSPDGSRIIALVNSEVDPETWDVYILSAADLRVLNMARTFWQPHLQWSPSGDTFLVYSADQNAHLMTTESGQETLIPVGGSDDIHEFIWSPGETYLLVSDTLNDWLNEFDVVTMQGELVIENVVVNVDYSGSHALLDWVNDNQVLANTSQMETAQSDLTLFDLPGGKGRIIHPQQGHYELSHDRRYAALTSDWTLDQTILLFDLSLDPPAATLTVNPDKAYDNYTWNRDRLELIVLFEDRSLRGYDPTTDTWRDITTIPGDGKMMDWLSCVAD